MCLTTIVSRWPSNSRFGIVVLSTAFISKGWTKDELDGIVTKAISGQQVILPRARKEVEVFYLKVLNRRR